MPDYADLLSPSEEVIDEPLENVDEPEPVEEDLTVSEEGDEPPPEGDEPPTEEVVEADAEPSPIGDGKTIPAELKELIKLHPDSAKLLKDMYFTNARYNKFGKVADLQKLKDYVDSYGSLDDAIKTKEQIDSIGDLNELVESNKVYSRLDEQFTAGDPAYVDHLAKVNPEAFSKLAPTFLSRFGSDHPEQYNYLMSQVVMSTLINTGTLNDISLLQQAAATGNVEQIKQVAARINESLGAIQGLSQKAPMIQRADPRVAKLEQEKQQIAQERQQMFVSDIKDRTNTWASPEIQKALAPYGRLRPELMKRLDIATKEEIGNILGQNTQFQSKIKQAISRGDRDGALRLYKQFVTPLVSTAAKRVAGEFGLKAAPKRQPTVDQNARPQTRNNRTPVESGFERVTKFPDVKDVRRDFDDYYDWAAKDQFMLKDGRKIKVVS